MRTATCLTRQDTLLTTEIQHHICLLSQTLKLLNVRRIDLARPMLARLLYEADLALTSQLTECHERSNSGRIHLIETPSTILIILTMSKRTADQNGWFGGDEAIRR